MMSEAQRLVATAIWSSRPRVVLLVRARPPLPITNTRTYAAVKPSPSASSSSASSGNIASDFPLPASPRASPYEIFHLPRHATPSQVKARYYDLVKIYHPDRSSLGTTASRRGASRGSKPSHGDFQRVQEAYSVLSDERRRKLYDVSGIGWNDSSSSSFGPAPPGWGGAYPTSEADRAAYEAFSDHLRRSGSSASSSRHGWERRGSPGGGARGHDKFGWQSYAGESGYFYGFHARDRAAPHDGLYTTNHRFFSLVSLLTFVLAVGQFIRLRQESKMVVDLADRKHRDAARSLDEARSIARSEMGRMRLDEMRKRHRQRLIEEGRASEWDFDGDSIGHGGPSGKDAYQERMKRISPP